MPPCANCSKSVYKTYPKGEQQYCKPCWDKLFGMNCAECGVAIGTSYKLEAHEAVWHPECYKCNICGERFEAKALFSKPVEVDGKPVHKKCMGEQGPMPNLIVAPKGGRIS